MKRVLVRSVYDAFDYVMAHYYPAGLEDLAEAKDHYAVISIQDTHTGGFGFVFTESGSCDGVLTLYFDDVEKEVDGAVLFSPEQAGQIIDFIEGHRETETLLIHCYGGQSRSRAVGAFAVRMLGGDNTRYFAEGSPNRHVYRTLTEVWQARRGSSAFCSAPDGGEDGSALIFGKSERRVLPAEGRARLRV